MKRVGKIRSWKLKDGTVAREFKERVLHKKARGVADQRVNEIWNNMKAIIVQIVLKICGRGRTGKPKGREEWWWSDGVQEAVKEKKVVFK